MLVGPLSVGDKRTSRIFVLGRVKNRTGVSHYLGPQILQVQKAILNRNLVGTSRGLVPGTLWRMPSHPLDFWEKGFVS